MRVTLRDTWRLMVAVPAMALLFVVGAWLPHSASTGDLQQRLDDANQAHSSLDALEAQVARARRDIDDLAEAYRDRSTGLVPDIDPMPEVIGRIARLTEAAGVVDHELMTLGQEEGEGYRAQRFRLTFSTGFEAAYEILDAIEHLHYLVNVRSMNLTRDSEQERLSVALELLAYARVSGDASAAGDTP
ncbi:hypothetical protein [Mucisphaera calidilacus]|uniref:Type 4a pilus biogenesis protein PilO n=1 Tax=Mucisphaera calidilacus TaxID=2527982 RepID=A0A518BTA1_9BACT|nr:hypothetical protein [Mucisphaera calidilacus]QDU70200.1 hypothetical protein Pan265_00220 [Mucisphaera calidilacus]